MGGRAGTATWSHAFTCAACDTCALLEFMCQGRCRHVNLWAPEGQCHDGQEAKVGVAVLLPLLPRYLKRARVEGSAEILLCNSPGATV